MTTKDNVQSLMESWIGGRDMTAMKGPTGTLLNMIKVV